MSTGTSSRRPWPPSPQARGPRAELREREGRAWCSRGRRAVCDFQGHSGLTSRREEGLVSHQTSLDCKSQETRQDPQGCQQEEPSPGLGRGEWAKGTHTERDSSGVILVCAHTYSHVSCAKQQLCVICTCKNCARGETGSPDTQGRPCRAGVWAHACPCLGLVRPPGRAPHPRLVLQQQLQLLQRQAHPQLLLRHQVHDLLHLVGEVLHGVHVQRLGGGDTRQQAAPAPFLP